jgi:pimeloyl-ACP methyl ester carboxylesterase
MPRRHRDERSDPSDWLWPFVAGVVAGLSGAAVARAVAARRRRRPLDHRLIQRSLDHDIPPVVIVPGVMGSCLERPDGTPVWLNMRTAFGYYSLGLPAKLPLADCRDDLRPGAIIGTEQMLPRLFGFTEYADLADLLGSAGFRDAAKHGLDGGLLYRFFTYDWRRDLVEAARRLHDTLEEMADARGDRDARFNVIGHSMGGLVARYYLRYGTAEPDEDAPVTWAGARRIANLALVTVPNSGGIHALEALLHGSRVGLSYTTMSSAIVSRMPSVFQLMPAPGVDALLDHELEPLHADLHDPETWERLGWGPYHPHAKVEDPAQERSFLSAVLQRAHAFHAALARRPATPCPVRVLVLGGDCLPTLARGVVPEEPGELARFEPADDREKERMYEAGDGRVTRASVLAMHLPWAHDSEHSYGIPEARATFFGAADHHGIYSEATFQSLLLRMLLHGTMPRTTPHAVEVGEPGPSLGHPALVRPALP